MDKMKTAYAQNDITGIVCLVPVDHLTHPVLGKHLTEVRGSKPRARLSEIVKDPAKGSARRVTNVVTPDKDKED